MVSIGFWQNVKAVTSSNGFPQISDFLFKNYSHVGFTCSLVHEKKLSIVRNEQ